MKTILRNFLALLIFSTIFAAPHVALAIGSAAFLITPAVTAAGQSLGSTTFGTAYTTNFTVTLQMGSSCAKAGVTFESLTVSPASSEVTASLSKYGPFNPGVAITTNSTLTVSASASAASGTYTVTFTAASTNLANLNSGITGTANTGVTKVGGGGLVTNIYTFVVGAVGTPIIIWTPAGVNTNWSTAGNWTPSGPPVSTNDVVFNDTGIAGAAGTVDNVVDSNFTIGSLTYGNTNNYHTTLIPSGVTLTVGGDANGLVAGTSTDPGSPAQQNGFNTYNTITGVGGVLAVTNTGATVFVSESHNVTTGKSLAQATLDLSGLGKFTATVSRLLVGVDLNIKGASGILNLAKTNTITATPGSASPQIDVGDNTQSQGSAAIPSILLLGQTNAFFADSIAVGRGKTDTTGSSMLFNSSFANPTAYFRGTSGAASRVGTWSIGDAWGSKITTFP
jgi:hypothetical protein